MILWDLDETLIALRSQLRHAGAVETVAMMEKLLGDYLDDVFFFNVFEQFDPENVCDYFEPDRVVDGAPHHDEFREQAAEGLAKDAVKYLEYAVAAYMTDSVAKPVPSLVWWQEWQQHLRNLDAFCNQWTAQAQKILAHLRDKGCLHMAVTNTSLVAALAKLKLWGLSSFFEVTACPLHWLRNNPLMRGAVWYVMFRGHAATMDLQLVAAGQARGLRAGAAEGRA